LRLVTSPRRRYVPAKESIAVFVVVSILSRRRNGRRFERIYTFFSRRGRRRRCGLFSIGVIRGVIF